MQFRGEESRVGVITRRQTIDNQLIRRARTQIETALHLMRLVYHEKLGELTDAINAATDADPDFYKEIARHPLNLDLFMKSSAAADAARASFDKGYAKGSVQHG